MKKLSNCPACKVAPGKQHKSGCDIEICSACGTQRISCHVISNCKGEHDALFARWTGIYPGRAEADYLGMDLNEFSSISKAFFVKPKLNNKY